MIYGIVEQEVKEIMVEYDCNKGTVQVISVIGITVLGSVAMIMDGSAGETIAIAVAAALGALTMGLFKGGKKNEVQ